jgi:hypothetical protein
MLKMQPKQGFSLTETILGLALLAAIMVPLIMTGGKTRALVATENNNRKLNFEVPQVLRNLSEDIRHAQTLRLVSPASSGSLLVLERYNPAGANFIQSQWRLTSNVLEYSADNGATWRSPYPVAAANAYNVTGAFSYCDEDNTCSSTPTTTTKKIRLNNWVFTGTNAQSNHHFEAPDIYLTLPNRALATTTTTVSDFSTNAGSFPSSGFTVGDLTYHPPTKQLVLVGGSNQIYRANAEGVILGEAITVTGTHTFSSIDLEPDGTFAWVVDTTAPASVYKIDMANGSVASSFALSTPGITNPRGLVYDEGDTTRPLKIVGTYGGSTQVISLDTTGGSATAINLTSGAVPAFVGTPAGLALDPLSGDMIIASQTVGSSAFTIYSYDTNNMNNSLGRNTTTSINLSQMGSSDTTTTRNFGLAFDPISNHVFVADPTDTQKRVFQVLPPRTLTRPL